MIELMLMRHAKSDWQSYSADIDRPLNDRGSRDATRIGEHLCQLKLIPDKALVSDAKRTQQTVQLLLSNLPLSENQVIFDNTLYLASRQTLCDTIRNHISEDHRLLILAHNPGMDNLVEYYASKPPPLSNNGKLMVTCAIALFRFDSLDALNSPGQGELINLIRPNEIT